MTAKKVIKVFSDIVKDIVVDDCYNLEFEVIADELLEGLYACAMAGYTPPTSSVAVSNSKLAQENNEIKGTVQNLVSITSIPLLPTTEEPVKVEAEKKLSEDLNAAVKPGNPKKGRESPTKEPKETAAQKETPASAGQKAGKKGKEKDSKVLQSNESLTDPVPAATEPVQAVPATPGKFY